MTEIRDVALADVLPLRQRILRPTQTLDECRFDGDDDPRAVHLGVGDPLLAIASVVPTPHRSAPGLGWRIRMVGVVEERRGEGIGQALVEACALRAVAAGAPGVWLSARLHLRPWYEHLGFEPVGVVYDKPPVGPHIDMRLVV